MLSLFLIFNFIETILANYYCEFGLCDDQNQYCCGLNKCCDKNSNLWLFWAGVLLVVFVLVVLTVCRRRRQHLNDEKFQLCSQDGLS